MSELANGGTTDFSLEFPRAHGSPVATASFRQTPRDFRVDEVLGFKPTGEGEHLYLHIRKRGENTDWLAGQLARFAGVTKRDVGYAGLKDRRAETTQWFSIYLPKAPERDWQSFAEAAEADVDVLEVARHTRKLRPGEHAGNRFLIRLTEVEVGGNLEGRLSQIADRGVPNYFGEQRFGRAGGNLDLAARWLEQGEAIRPRKLRGLVMSAARSWLFNQVLAERVREDNWDRPLEGEAATESRQPTGPLWGRGRPASRGSALAVEESALAPWAVWRDGLEHVGLQQERRSLVLRPEQLEWRLEEGALSLGFTLPPGQFATALLREIAWLGTAETAPAL